MRDDWARSPSWDGVSRSDFERRLERSRPSSRAQYLTIKAHALSDAEEVAVARTLLQRVLDMPDVRDSERAWATELLGDLELRDGRAGEAERHYRQVLDRWPSLNGTSGTVEIKLAEVLAARTGAWSNDEVRELLDSYLARPALKFDKDLFRLHLVLIRLSIRAGDGDAARHAATAALELAGRGPRLPQHESVGVVSTDAETLRWLGDLADR